MSGSINNPSALGNTIEASELPLSVVSGSPTGGVPAWVKETEYALNALISYGGSTYICKETHKSAATFAADESKWQSIGAPATNSSKFVDARANLKIARPEAACVIWLISLAQYEAKEEPEHAAEVDLVIWPSV